MASKVSASDWEEVWSKLQKKGWELQKHGEQKRSHYLLPDGQKDKATCRVGSYVTKLTAKDGSGRCCYRTRAEVMKHVGALKPAATIKKKTVAPAKIRFKTTTFILTAPALPAKANKSRKSPPVSPTLEPLAATVEPSPMTANFVKPPPPAECPVCLEAFCDMPPTKKVIQLDRCNHFVCNNCIDQESGVCPTADCGQRFLSTRRARKLTAEEVVPAPLPGSPSKPKPKLKSTQLRKWQQVSVTWEGNAYDATVTELSLGTFRVHYTNTNKKYDETLSREALQLRAPAWTSGSPSKTLSSPAFVAENYQAHGKPLPISAGLSIMSQTEDKATDEFTPTGGFEFRQRCSPRKLNTAKKQIQAAKTAKAKHKPRSSAIRVKTPRAASASLATVMFSPPSLSGGCLPAWRRRPLPPGLTSDCRRRPPRADISLIDAGHDDSSEFELLLKVVDRACTGQY